MKYRIRHTTTYEYAELFSSCHNSLHLTPRDLPTQWVLDSSVAIYPEPTLIQRHIDWYGNTVDSFSLNSPSDLLSVSATSEVEVKPHEPPMLQLSLPWELIRDDLAGDAEAERFDALQYIFDSPYVKASAALLNYARQSFTPKRPLLEAAMDLTHRIHEDFEYDPKSTTLHTSVLEVLQNRRGVCQDFAHLQVGCLRSLGLPARYVSGYLRTVPFPGQARLVGADASHAWCGVWCPQMGWVDFDPTNDRLTDDDYITLAWGSDYGDVSPIKGVVLGGGVHRVGVSVDVEPLE